MVVNQMGLGSVGEHAVRAAFKQVDKNKNGKIDMNEALELVRTVSNLFQQKAKTGDAPH